MNFYTLRIFIIACASIIHYLPHILFSKGHFCDECSGARSSRAAKSEKLSDVALRIVLIIWLHGRIFRTNKRIKIYFTSFKRLV